ncbi:MAG: sigma-54-dependent Fis family transcriptional regulator [Candidatus Aureabacteria bacterium]|nr:sigma-54-dependent Fis family transcriptional regulator [Candidatus Auribacterota bacterium]
MKTILCITHHPEKYDLHPFLDEQDHKMVFLKPLEDLNEQVKKTQPHLVLLEAEDSQPDMHKAIKDIRKSHFSYLPVIIIGPSGNTKSVVESIKAGAADFVPKPFRRNELASIILSNLKISRSTFMDSFGMTDESLQKFFGVSHKIKATIEQIKMIAPTDMTVMIQGASGTGKEIIAHLIHRMSRRARENYISIDCGALPEPLLESELYGYERGAFTGAYAIKPGMIEIADRGTLFLDEIGNLSSMNQMKLLRFLEERMVMRLGGKKKRSVNVRIIVATNSDLKEAVKKKEFRLDLFYRLSEFIIHLPLLTERKEDLPSLCVYFLGEAERKLKKRIAGISPEAMDVLMQHEWPGNIRELKNVITSASLLARDIILPEHLKIKHVEDTGEQETFNLYKEDFDLKNAVKQAVSEVEKKYIVQALIAARGNKTLAARKLKIDRTALYQKIREYQITV